MLDLSAYLFNGDSPDVFPLLSPVGGACVVLAMCLLFGLLWRNRSARGTGCRPDEPFRGQAEARITSLVVYPIKSCAGIEVQEAKLGTRGLEMDRLWMVVDRSGRFMSQRRCAKMALISPSLPKSEVEPLILSAPGKTSIKVPVARKVGSGGPEAGGKLLEVEIWRDTCRAIDQGDAVASWLSDFLETENLRLVRMKDGFVRPTSPEYGRGFETGFSDGFAMLLVADESLEELNSRMPDDEVIGMDRFRPNIVVRGWGAFAEDNWTKIKTGTIVMRLPKPCSRCVVPSTNQSTLERRAEPRRTLSSFRAGSQVVQWNESWANDVFFGMNVQHEKKGVLRVGDVVEVLRVAKPKTESGLKKA